MILAHAAIAQDRPAAGVAEACQAARDRVGQVLGGVGVKAEAIALVAFAHGVVQAAGGAHDRDGAVAQRDQLAQAARLIARGHQERVAAGVDPLRQRRVEAQLDVDAGGAAAHMLGEGPLHSRLAAAEQHQIRVGLGYQPGYHGVEQVDAFLLDQPRDDAEQRPAGVDREAALALQRQLADRLAADVVGAVVGGDMWVARGIEGVVVDPVDDAGQLVLARAQQFVELLAILWRQDLLRVGRADGADDIGVANAAGHEVDIIIAIAAEAGQVERKRVEEALVGQVMDGEDRREAAERAAVGGLEVVGQQAGMPIVGVHRVGAPALLLAQVQQQRRDAARKQDEAPVVVVRAKDRIAVEGAGDIQQVDRRVAQPGQKDPHDLHLVAGRQEGSGERPVERRAAGVEAPVAWHHDPCVVAQPAQRSRERRSNYG